MSSSGLTVDIGAKNLKVLARFEHCGTLLVERKKPMAFLGRQKWVNRFIVIAQSSGGEWFLFCYTDQLAQKAEFLHSLTKFESARSYDNKEEGLSGFSIRFEDDKEASLVFFCSHEVEREDWVTKLNRTIELAHSFSNDSGFASGGSLNDEHTQALRTPTEHEMESTTMWEVDGYNIIRDVDNDPNFNIHAKMEIKTSEKQTSERLELQETLSNCSYVNVKFRAHNDSRNTLPKVVRSPTNRSGNQLGASLKRLTSKQTENLDQKESQQVGDNVSRSTEASCILQKQCHSSAKSNTNSSPKDRPVDQTRPKQLLPNDSYERSTYPATKHLQQRRDNEQNGRHAASGNEVQMRLKSTRRESAKQRSAGLWKEAYEESSLYKNLLGHCEDDVEPLYENIDCQGDTDVKALISETHLSVIEGTTSSSNKSFCSVRKGSDCTAESYTANAEGPHYENVNDNRKSVTSSGSDNSETVHCGSPIDSENEYESVQFFDPEEYMCMDEAEAKRKLKGRSQGTFAVFPGAESLKLFVHNEKGKGKSLYNIYEKNGRFSLIRTEFDSMKSLLSYYNIVPLPELPDQTSRLTLEKGCNNQS